MKKAFTLVELIIVAAILGIMAAIIIPTFKSLSIKAKESAARANLKILRGTIELYSTQHDDVAPGYENDDPTNKPTDAILREQIVELEAQALPATGMIRAGILDFPVNPFNDKDEVLIIDNEAAFPIEPKQTKTYGWIYQPSNKTIRINWLGSDKSGLAYFDY